MKQEHDGYDGNCAEGKINIEAESPSYLVLDLISHQHQRFARLSHFRGCEGKHTVKTPPSNGPATLAIPHIPPIAPMKVGLLCSGTVCARIISAPENKPAAPTPAIARPTMRPMLEGVKPQRSDPASNMLIEEIKTYLIEKVEYSLPYKS